MKLSDIVGIESRFSRSINIELDSKASSVNDYFPTGRALDVIRRVALSIIDGTAGRAFSITGPYGSGKSSLALFLDALLDKPGTELHKIAWKKLKASDSDTFELLQKALNKFGSENSGFIRATVTADRESITRTILRALYKGAEKHLNSKEMSKLKKLFKNQEASSCISPRDIKVIVEKLIIHAPILLVIDEFGKNLEEYSKAKSEGDPFLLQELAEWSKGADGLPIVIMTLQHLAFDEYVLANSKAQRREWSKVQGRFEDIPYIETSAQTRTLISSVFSLKSKKLIESLKSWDNNYYKKFGNEGLLDLEKSSSTETYPLHPLTLDILPELCSKYGQNERTLFSFLAGSESKAIPNFLNETNWNENESIRFVGFNRIYDYFVENAQSMISVASSSSRWLEIETRIRDVQGLNTDELNILKTIGIINLIASGGKLRASKNLLNLALEGTLDRSSKDDTIDEILTTLEKKGLITYRDFADEYRIWSGSDFDLQGTIKLAHRNCQQRSLADILNNALPLKPIVAARHSQQFGILRFFERRFCDLEKEDISALSESTNSDGLILYELNTKDKLKLPTSQLSRPVIYIQSKDLSNFKKCAMEAATLFEAVKLAESSDADWIARRELIERASLSRQLLNKSLVETFVSTTYKREIVFSDIKNAPSKIKLSTLLSDVSDEIFNKTPRIGNEMLARRELSPQGTMARRLLVAAMISSPASELLEIEGYGPERSMYEAFLKSSGIHRKRKGNAWSIGQPVDENYLYIWREIQAEFKKAISSRVNLADISEKLQKPPIGLNEGAIPVFIIATLISNIDTIALYEHGTLILAIDDAISERLLKNLDSFSIKNTAAKSEIRKNVVDKLIDQLDESSNGSKRTFLQLARVIYRKVYSLPKYVHKTKNGLSDEANLFCNAFREASEPDVLIFETIPMILGFKPFMPSDLPSKARVKNFTDKVIETLDELENAYGMLLNRIAESISKYTKTPKNSLRKKLCAYAASLEGKVLEPNLKLFVGSLLREELSDDAWIENVAMVVTGGETPRNWRDDSLGLFDMAIAEIGGAFRRVQILLFEQYAKDYEGFDAFRVVVTSSNGEERSKVVFIDEVERQAISPLLEKFIDNISQKTGDSDKTKDIILALLASNDKKDRSPSLQKASKPLMKAKNVE